jgi:hypothetical protein
LQANFGGRLPSKGLQKIPLVIADPSLGCTDLRNSDDLKDAVAVFDRGHCYFVDKVRRAQKAGAIAAIIINNIPVSTRHLS